jgi:DivIVA domain-containing protein
MADQRAPLAGGESLSADLIAQTGFATSRRGYEVSEVRDFLARVASQVRELQQRVEAANAARRDAEERARHPHIDEETLLGAVGEETAAILRTARTAAADIRSKAEEQATARLRESHAQADAMRAEAEAVLARRTAEAEEAADAMRAAAIADAERMRAAAREEAEALRQQADQERRLTIESAQAIREKILSDLTRRRRVATVQIEQLRAGRERLLDAYAVVRRTLDDVTDELHRADAEARAAADAVDIRAVGGFDGDLPDEDAAVLRSTWPAAPVHRPAPAAGAQAAPRSAPAGETDAPAPGATPAPAPAPAPALAPAPAPAGQPPPVAAGGPPAAGLPPGTAPARPAPPGSPWLRSAGAPGAALPEVPPATDADEVAPTGVNPVLDLDALTADQPAAPDVESADTPTGEVAFGTFGAGEAAADDAQPGPTAGAAGEGQSDLVAANGAGDAQSGAGAAEASEPVTAPTAVIRVDEIDDEAGEDLEEEAARAAGADGPHVERVTDNDSVRILRGATVTATPRSGRARNRRSAHPGSQPGHLKPTEPGARSTAPDVAAPDVAAPVPDASDRVAPDTGAPDGAGGAGEPPADDVGGLFARIRAGEPAPAPTAVAASEPAADDELTEPGPDADGPAPETAPGEEVVLDIDEMMLQRRDQAVADIEVALSRRLKRVLQDEQNDLLDRLRGVRGTPKASSVLPALDVQRSVLVDAGRPHLEQASAAGAGFGRAMVDVDAAEGAEDAPIDDLAEELADLIARPLRRRLEQAFADNAGDDQAVLVEALGSAYREWKSHRVEQLAGDAVAGSFSRGAFEVVPEGTPLRWLVEDVDGPCPDCDDNALAGSLLRGELFPTGQAYPPAHAGCRCLLVATTEDS